jgi:hypothetical protein
MNRPECWIQGPGMVEFNAASDRRLTRVANWAGMKVRKTKRVHAELLAGTKLVIVTAAQSTDLSAISVNRYGSSSTFNLVDLLAEHGLQVESGYRERYEVAYVPKASFLYPFAHRNVSCSARCPGAGGPGRSISWISWLAPAITVPQ